jgi:divalent metal cation (Fe/Co/Zn/Cd) transporter
VLEFATLGWNVVAIFVLGVAAWSARSVALAGFGLDSLIEIGASAVVVWELSDASQRRRQRALVLIRAGFAGLAVYLVAQSTWALVVGHHAGRSVGGMAWTAVTAAVMFALAAGKAHVGAVLDNAVLQAEGRVTLVDGLLASAVLVALALDAALGWWWADPLAGYLVAGYAIREVRHL